MRRCHRPTSSPRAEHPPPGNSVHPPTWRTLRAWMERPMLAREVTARQSVSWSPAARSILAPGTCSRSSQSEPVTVMDETAPAPKAIHRPNTVSPRTQLRDPVETLSAPIRCPTAPAARRRPQPGAILLQTLPKTERNNMTVGNTFVHHQLLSTHFPLAREQAALC